MSYFADVATLEMPALSREAIDRVVATEEIRARESGISRDAWQAAAHSALAQWRGAEIVDPEGDAELVAASYVVALRDRINKALGMRWLGRGLFAALGVTAGVLYMRRKRS